MMGSVVIPKRKSEFTWDLLVQFLREMATSRFPTETRTKFKSVKIQYIYLWYILATLNHVREDKFQETTGLRYWDAGMVMVDTLPLAIDEYSKALRYLTDILYENENAVDRNGRRVITSSLELLSNPVS